VHGRCDAAGRARSRSHWCCTARNVCADRRHQRRWFSRGQGLSARARNKGDQLVVREADQPRRGSLLPSHPERARAENGPASLDPRGRDRAEWAPLAGCRIRAGELGPEHSYGVRPVNRARLDRPRSAGEVGGESASAVVDVCVATHMRGLGPHDRLCELRSGAVLSRRAWPLRAALSVLSGRSSRRCAGALSSPSCCGGATPSSRAPSNARRVRARRRRRRSSGACRGSRVRASVRAAAGRCVRPGLAPRAVCPLVCARA
jgi:hypothetical protein